MAITVAEVQAIYGASSALHESQVQSIINMVESLATEWFAGVNYSATMQNAINRYLAAHFLAVAYENGGVIRKKTGSSEEQYNILSNDAVGLKGTIYGQQALALDTKGALAVMAMPNTSKAEFRLI